MASMAATRVGDMDLPHCSPMVRAQGSPNVYVNGLPWSREGDFNTPHLKIGIPCGVHIAEISNGSSTVKVNGLGAGRVGDSLGNLLNGCTFVAEGSSNVFAGG
jgi:uncharacterized Zn-binding protein involved in type VI secretion